MALFIGKWGVLNHNGLLENLLIFLEMNALFCPHGLSLDETKEKREVHPFVRKKNDAHQNANYHLLVHQNLFEHTVLLFFYIPVHERSFFWTRGGHIDVATMIVQQTQFDFDSINIKRVKSFDYIWICPGVIAVPAIF